MMSRFGDQATRKCGSGQVRPHVLRTPYASLNLMADVARTTHPDHLLRANPESEFGYPDGVFYMRLPFADAWMAASASATLTSRGRAPIKEGRY
ncbi:MAG: hypothetical protein VR64_06715 [Desulfatitalea sp. BRH_c12]|nr:MAG: hypothetical protein VR64_06715 [Desulfatitalea sp. BRH_c12]